MKKYISSELKRNLWNKNILIAIVFGLLFYIIPTYLYISKYLSFNFDAPDLKGNEETAKLMIQKALNAYHVWDRNIGVYIISIPLICCIPYVADYFYERKTGAIKNILIRMSWKDYLFSKYLVNGILGGMAASIPTLIYSIVILFSFPRKIIEFNIYPLGPFSGIFHYNPLLYIGIYIVMHFIAGVIFASLGLALSHYIKKYIWVITSSFTLYLILAVVAFALKFYLFSPDILTHFALTNEAKPIHLFIVISYMTVAIFILSKKGIQKEI